MEKENLRSEDLMVGDWVLLWGDKPARVDCIGNVEVYLSEPMGQHELDWKVTYEHIKPIPLTPEILEKNGWEKYDEDSKDFHGHNCVFIKQNDGCYGVCVDHKRTVSGTFKYVQELQHALRLCGIDKPIVL